MQSFSISSSPNKDCNRRLYTISRREISLIHRQSQMPARIDVQQWFVQGHVAEGAHERNIHLALANGHVHRLASHVAQLEEILAADVCDQIAERSIGRDDFSAQPAFV